MPRPPFQQAIIAGQQHVGSTRFSSRYLQRIGSLESKLNEHFPATKNRFLQPN